MWSHLFSSSLSCPSSPLLCLAAQAGLWQRVAPLPSTWGEERRGETPRDSPYTVRRSACSGELHSCIPSASLTPSFSPPVAAFCARRCFHRSVDVRTVRPDYQRQQLKMNSVFFSPLSFVAWYLALCEKLFFPSCIGIKHYTPVTVVTRHSHHGGEVKCKGGGRALGRVWETRRGESVCVCLKKKEKKRERFAGSLRETLPPTLLSFLLRERFHSSISLLADDIV